MARIDDIDVSESVVWKLEPFESAEVIEDIVVQTLKVFTTSAQCGDQSVADFEMEVATI